MTARLLVGLTMNLLGLTLAAVSAGTSLAGFVVGCFIFGWGVNAYFPSRRRR